MSTRNRRYNNRRGYKNNKYSQRGYNNRGYNRSRDPKAAADSGNKRERIAVESGHLVLIDQFMLANPQFFEQLQDIIDEAPEVKNDLVKKYGGIVIDMSPGTCRIERDPYKASIIIYKGDNLPEEVEKEEKEHTGDLLIDTRCMAMIDRELLDDSLLLKKYQELWFEGNQKACRDLIRDNGGAVRYGFNRSTDELNVYSLVDEDTILIFGHRDEIEKEEGQEENQEQQEAIEVSE